MLGNPPSRQFCAKSVHAVQTEASVLHGISPPPLATDALELSLAETLPELELVELLALDPSDPLEGV